METSIAKLVPSCTKFLLFLARFQSSKYQISENFTKRFGFSQFSSFLVNFGCFLVKKRPKKAEIQKKFFCSIFFVGKHLHTKFQKISSNGLDFANFLHFCQFWPFFSQKRQKSKIGLCGEFSFTKRHLRTKF